MLELELLSNILGKCLFSITFENLRPTLPVLFTLYKDFYWESFLETSIFGLGFFPLLLFFRICNEKFASIAT